MGTQASKGHAPPREFWKLDAQICYFWHIFTINMKAILYITLKVQAAQNVTTQNDLTWKTKKFKNFFTINSPAKTRQTGPLLPAL